MRFTTMVASIVLPIAAVLCLSPTSTCAATVYSLDDETLGLSARGTITTDSSVGTLTAANILGWNLLLDTGSQSFLLDPSNSQVAVAGTGLSATATSLFYDFGKAESGYFIFQNPVIGSGINFLCFDDLGGSCNNATASVVIFTEGGEGGAFRLGNSNEAIAVVIEQTPTPLPPSVVLLASALGGLGLLGCRQKTTTPRF